MFQHFSHQHGTAGRLLRLSYAIDMRYGVLHDVARKLLQREAIDLAMGDANIIWQGDANEGALRALAHCTTPTSALNLSGPRIRIRDVAQALGRHAFRDRSRGPCRKRGDSSGRYGVHAGDLILPLDS